MAWVKLDDTFPTNEKVVQAGERAAWLYVCGLCYCNANLTDGRIPKPMVGRLVAKPAGLADRLVMAGLWEDEGPCFVVHDFHDYQPSGASVRAQRRDVSEARSRAGRKGAASRWQTDGKADGKPMAPTRPVLPTYIEGLLTLVPEEPVENLSREDIWKKLRKTETA